MIKIFAIRDRLVDYYLTPFAAHEDKGVLNSIANLINKEDSNDPVAQAPHHFEIWRLGEVQEDGTLIAKREFLADCSSLIRAGRPATGPGQAALPTTARFRTGTTHGAHSGSDSNERPLADQAPAKDRS